MEKLHTVVSSVHTFSDRMETGYSKLAGSAEQVREYVDQLHTRVRMAEDRVGEQVRQIYHLRDEAEAKVTTYDGMRAQAETEVRVWEDRVQDVLNNPIAVTETDEDGNSYTHYETDYAALAAAERGRDAALAEYNHYNQLYMEASAVASEAAQAQNRFVAMQNGIQAVERSIQAEYDQICRMREQLQAEAMYNMESLHQVQTRLTEYLGSISFFQV